MEATLSMLGILIRAYADKLAETASRMLLQNSVICAQFEAVQDTRLGAFVRAALLYKLLLVVAATVVFVLVYSLAATYKQFVQDLLTRLLNEAAKAIVEDGDHEWFGAELRRRTPIQVRFNESVVIGSTYSPTEYDRRENRRKISPELIHEAKTFLEEYKTNEMQVHPASRHNTHMLKLR